MTREELLLELKDIGAPPEPAWWLLAPAHSILIALALGALVFAWIWWRQRRSRQLLRLAALELNRIETALRDHGDKRELSLALSRWLKQVALAAYPQSGLEALSGDPWLEFLDQTLGRNSFSRGEGRVFGDAIYRRQAEFDAGALLDLCRGWLHAIEPRLLQRGRH